ncbi:MAG: DHH family phosphoesterase [Bacteroidaceae bacterium]|nr:DHH family phosphoesterase [Bacteroidaceae bacterium]
MITPIISAEKIEQLREAILLHNNIVITSHVSPDGDAIGSSLGLYHYLRKLNKQVTVVLPDMVPRNLHFLSGMRYVVYYTQQPEKAVDAIAKADMIFSLDYNALHRIDKLSSHVSESKAYKVLIDHHLDPEPFCDITISHPEISSTCELIFRVIWQMGHYRMMGRSTAEAIYTGMMTDTGNFTYNSNQPEIYSIISQLVKKHIDKDQIYNLACNTQTANKLLLNSYAICNKMELFPEYGAAMISLTREEMTSYNFQKGDCDGLVNVPLSIKGIYFSVFIREDREYIKISLRSQGDFAVNTIAAEHFGGGGHKNAAGGEFYGTLDEAIAKFREVLPMYCEKNINE